MKSRLAKLAAWALALLMFALMAQPFLPMQPISATVLATRNQIATKTIGESVLVSGEAVDVTISPGGPFRLRQLDFNLPGNTAALTSEVMMISIDSVLGQSWDRQIGTYSLSGSNTATLTSGLGYQGYPASSIIGSLPYVSRAGDTIRVRWANTPGITVSIDATWEQP